MTELKRMSLLTFASAAREGVHLSPQMTSEVLTRAIAENIQPEAIRDWYELSYPAAPAISNIHLSEARDRINRTFDLGIECMLISDLNYPIALRTVENAPPVLYWKGSFDILGDLPGLAVVGTRKATVNGIKIAERIAAYFAERGWPIISGLALGIDAAAHRGALMGKGVTVAVLAHGLELAYPRTNKDLAAEILERGGAWVSEYPVGIGAKPEQFVARNRIQIGLSAGSVIVEGEEQSGSMTQAEFCLRNSRALFAVLEQPNTRSLGLLADGPKILVSKRGATAIFSKDDYPKVEKIICQKRSALNIQNKRAEDPDQGVASTAF